MGFLGRCLFIALITLISLTSQIPVSFGAGMIKPVITGTVSEDGSIQINMSIGPGAVSDGNWFYQVRNYQSGCENPYGNDTTWNTNTLPSTFQIGLRIDIGIVDRYDLRKPLTNGCKYLIRVAHRMETESEYAETFATPGPTAQTLAATSITSNQATLNASINANDGTSEVSFCYGTNSNLVGCTLRSASVNGTVAGSQDSLSSLSLLDLGAGSTYYFRVIASGTNGDTYGEIRKFQAFSDGTDGLLNGGIATGTYSAIENSLEARLTPFVTEEFELFFVGSRQKMDGEKCAKNMEDGVVKKIRDSGEPDTSFASGELLVSMADKSVSFSGFVEDMNSDIYLLGSAATVTETITDGGFSCGYSYDTKFVLKISENGVIQTNFSGDGYLYINEILQNEIPLSMTEGFLNELTLLGDGTIMISVSEHPDFDLIFVKEDGTLNTAYGDGGITKLDKSNIRHFATLAIPNQIVLAGDKGIGAEDWEARGALTSIDASGNELATLQGNNNYMYTSGQKEGIYVRPQFREPYIYVLTGVLRSTGSYDLQVLRLNQNGILDSSYGGYLKSDLQAIGVNPIGYGSGEFVVDDYGRILVAVGTETYIEGRRQSALVRIDEFGRLDTSFGSDGKIWIDYDYQAGVYRISPVEFFVAGVQYSSLNCSGSTCGLYRNYITRFTQFPLLSRPEVTVLDSDEGGFTFRITNYDAAQNYSVSSEIGIASVISDDGVGRVTGLRPGLSASITIQTSRIGFGSSNRSFSGSSLYSAEQREAIEESRRREEEEEARKQSEVIREQARAELINLSNESQLSAETLRQAGVFGVLPEIFKDLNRYLLALDKQQRGDISSINKKVEELVFNFRFSELEKEITTENLALIGLKGYTQSMFTEVKTYLEQTEAVEKRDLQEIQRIVDMVAIFEDGRKSGNLSEAQLNKLGVSLAIERKKAEILSKFRNQPREVFQDINSIQAAIATIEAQIQARLDRATAGKEKTRLLRERMQNRKP